AGVAVLAPEFPGFGGAPPEEAPTIAGVADRVAAQIAATAAGRAVVCGLSMGGYVALAVAARHPARVARLVLASTRADADDAAARAGRDAAIARVRGGDLAGWRDEFVPRVLAADAPDGVLRAVRDIAARQTPGAVAAALAALRDRPDRRGDLAAVRVPALAVWGDRDRVTPREAMEAIAAGIPDARLAVIPGAGHMTAIERPEEFAEAIGPLLP
ncbi:MAG: alpha/beta fold hydrolase, partial [Actinomycetota bacterium]